MSVTRSYPSRAEIYGEEYRFDRILKEDFFSVNVLYRNQEGGQYVLKLSDFRFVLGWLFRPLAGWISRREYRIYQMVSDIPGIPELGPRHGKRGYFHRFIEGKTLHEIEQCIHDHPTRWRAIRSLPSIQVLWLLTFSNNYGPLCRRFIGGASFMRT